MNGAQKDYKSIRQKNNWRRWNWNRIVENLNRTGVLPCEAMVIYLAGQKDLDRPIALDRGFLENNMFCVERDSGVALNLKKEKKAVLNYPLQEVIKDWPEHRRAHVILADFCCGWERYVTEFLVFLQTNRAFRRAIVSLNLMRGRDPYSNDFRSFVSERFDLDSKNRAKLCLAAALDGFVGSLAQHGLESQHCVESPSAKKYLESILDISENTYKSGNIVFDSVVFESPSMHGYSEWLASEINKMHAVFPDKIEKAQPIIIKNSKTQTEVGRSVAALMAIRTMRSRRDDRPQN